MKRALQMRPKPTTSQQQRAAAIASANGSCLFLLKTNVHLPRVTTLCHAPSTALLWAKRGGNIQQEM